MSKYYVGFKFTDSLWGDGDQAEIIGQDRHGRWEVRWLKNDPECTYETDKTITELIEG